MFAHLANDAAGIGVKDAIAIHVANAADGLANPLFEVKLGITRYLARQHNEVALGQCFARDPAERVLLEAGIENVIADRVANFIGMTFRDRFRGKDIMMRHENKK